MPKTARETAPPMPQQMSGADVLIQSLVNAGVTTLFAYPGGSNIPLHQAMTRYRDKIRVILPRHEQGGGFAAQGYARSTGKIGVCTAISGPGATNLITAIADAKLDSIPLLAITGQVARKDIGSDAFQETPTTGMCQEITKHHYLVTDVNDIPRIVKEAIHIATTGRPGPVLIDLPKDLQAAQCIPNFDVEMRLPGYPHKETADGRQQTAAEGEPGTVSPETLEEIVAAIKKAKNPVLCVGGGIVAADAAAELRKFAELTQIPVATTMMGLATFPRDHSLSLGMPGMHGTAYANHAIHESDLLLAFGVRFSDRVTGRASEFAKHATIVHVDIDPSEIGKIKDVQIGVVADVKAVLQGLLKKMSGYKPAPELAQWHQKIERWKNEMPMGYNTESPHILPQYVIEELCRQTQEQDAIIVTGVGQHQMWTTQFYRFDGSRSRQWVSSCGLGTMGFGLPAAMGAKAANPDKLVINIDGDGSLQMNIQEMATCFCEKIPVKVIVLNNQHLGMVMQWEDKFFKGNRGNTYLGPIDDPESMGKGEGIGPAVRYPDYVAIAKGYGWDALLVSDKSEVPSAIKRMLDSPGAFLLDVTIPYQEHVLPMIPAGATLQEMIRR